MRRDRWNTYRTTCYFGSFGGDPRAAGGVCHHQIKRGTAGWQMRQQNANCGRYEVCTVEPISDANGEAKYEQAQAC